MYNSYNGSGAQLFLFWVCIFALLFYNKREEREKAKFFAGYALAFLLIFVCPLTAWIIMEYCTGASVYWRMLWILPITVVIAYEGTNIIAGKKRVGKKLFAFAGALLLIFLSGTNIMAQMQVDTTRNNTKLNPVVEPICYALEEDAAQRKDGEIKVIVPNELVCYIRQFDAAVKMPYGRDATRGLDQNEIYDLLQAESLDCAALAQAAQNNGCNYLVYDYHWDEELESELEAEGFAPIGQISGYTLYYYKKKA
jgi:hypothetical protein